QSLPMTRSLVLAAAASLALAPPALAAPPLVTGPRELTPGPASFHLSARGARGYRCALDGHVAVACPAAYHVTLGTGRHALRVRAVDAHGRPGQLATAAITVIPAPQSVRVGASPVNLAFGAGSLWVACNGDGTVARVDPGSGRILQRVQVGGGPAGVTAGD